MICEKVYFVNIEYAAVCLGQEPRLEDTAADLYRSGEIKTATWAFERVDEDTIGVTVASGDKSFAFHVSKLGVITEADE